jgi:hypothetical protein
MGFSAVQVLDSTGVFRSGKIISLANEKFRIHFDNFCQKHDGSPLFLLFAIFSGCFVFDGHSAKILILKI